MKKMRLWLWGASLALLPVAMQAQVLAEDGQVRLFVRSIEEGRPLERDADAPVLEAGDVAEARRRIWDVWRRANAEVEEPKLPAVAALDAGRTGQIVLPDSLEPSAVMDYYWGRKGQDTLAGSLPVFVYLHGSGPRDAEWSTGFKLANRFEDAPSLYFIPRIPNEGAYYRWWQRGKQWAWEWLLRQLMLCDEVDARRIYVLGISEGGYGGQRLASFYADYWAAAGPMAGGEPLKNAPAENCGCMGFSLLTGAEDDGFYRNLLTGWTAEAFDSLANACLGMYPHRVELVPGCGHAIDYRPTTPWLKSFVRQPSPSEYVWEDFEMDGRHRRGFYNLLVEKRPCDTLRTMYKVRIRDNKVDMEISDVRYRTVLTDSIWGIELRFEKTLTPATGGELTLFLDEHLVDLRRKVTVKVNGRRVFRGRVTCREADMMRSLSAFYDRWRIYPASVRVRY